MKLVNWLFAFALFGATHLSAQECCDTPCDTPPASAYSCRGKFEIAPAYVHIDFLQKGHTHHTADYAAIRSDLSYRVWSGLILKPVVMYGKGKGDNEILTGGIGVGFCIPVTCIPGCTKLFVTPTTGINWGYIRGSFKHELAPGQNLDIKERFRSTSPYIALEVSWTFIPTWRVVGSYQYAWSRTHNKITYLENTRSHSKGSVISGMLEHDFNDQFSINLGAAYNNSLSHEKDGVRGWGLKLGFAYWF
jgi:hypothetical protein